MKVVRQVIGNFNKVDFNLVSSIYFAAFCLIYNLLLLDMSFKLTFLKTKLFQKTVKNRKTRCILAWFF